MASKTKTNKALLITSIVLTVLALLGLTFSAIMGNGVDELLHPDTTGETTEGESDAGEQAGRAIASVFVAILFIPFWILIELITVVLSIPSIVMSSTLCGRLARESKQEKIETAGAEQSEWQGQAPAAAAPQKPGMKIAAVVLIVLNALTIAACVVIAALVLG